MEDEFVYLVMEYCDGGDLLGTLQAHPTGYFEEALAVRYFRQIVRAVNYLHRNGIAHRDLSLENILLRAGVVKLCDLD